MKKLSLTLLILALTHAREQLTEPLKIDIRDTDYIAVYECKEGKLKLIWYDRDLEEDQIKEIKELEGQPCKK